MLDNLKKYWFLYVPLSALIVWGVSIDSRLWESAKQQAEVINKVEEMPTVTDMAIQNADAKHAKEIRQMRYEYNKRNDSIKAAYNRKKDSITLDYIKRQTVQIEQIKAKLDETN